jgi:signal peptidase II
MTGSHRARSVVILLACLATIGCDRVTKHVAATMLAGNPPRSLLADTVRLSYAENTGGFLSLGADLPPARRVIVFTITTGLLLLGLAATAIRARWQGARLGGVALIVAGGASNWIDRVAAGSVVDFMNIGIGPVRTGIFNVADVAIMFGVALIVIGASATFRGSPAAP